MTQQITIHIAPNHRSNKQQKSLAQNDAKRPYSIALLMPQWHYVTPQQQQQLLKLSAFLV